MFFGLYETLALLIQGAYLMHEGLTPTSEKPKISFSCGLDISGSGLFRSQISFAHFLMYAGGGFIRFRRFLFCP